MNDYLHVLRDIVHAAQRNTNPLAIATTHRAALKPHLDKIRTFGLPDAAEVLSALVDRRFGDRDTVPLHITDPKAIAIAANAILGAAGLATPETTLDPKKRERVNAQLTALGFGHVQAPEVIEWRPSKNRPGVSHGTSLHLDTETGDIVIPIRQAPGSDYGEHVHGGPEGIILLSDGGTVVDNTGWYGPNTPYRQDPGSVHNPVAVGQGVIEFLGVSKGGVLMTGLPQTRGAVLASRYSILSGPLMAILFFPITEQTPLKARQELSTPFFRLLDAIDRAPATDYLHAKERAVTAAREFLSNARTSPRTRIDFTRQALAALQEGQMPCLETFLGEASKG